MSDRTAETPTTKLDPATAIREAMQRQLHDVKLRADDGAKRMVEDHLLERVVILGTQNSELLAANETLTKMAGEMSAANEALLQELAAYRAKPVGEA